MNHTDSPPFIQKKNKMSFTRGLFILVWMSVTYAGTTHNVNPDKAYRFVSPVSLTPEGNFQFCVPSGDR